MRCLSCNKILSDFESTRKYRYTHQFVDLCNLCFNLSGLKYSEVTERTDLKHNEDDLDDEY